MDRPIQFDTGRSTDPGFKEVESGAGGMASLALEAAIVVDASRYSLQGPNPPASGPSFVAISKFTIANGMTSQVKEAFRNRPHKVDDADGFLRMEVISPVEDPDEIWLITFWRDEVSFKAWHHSHLYRDSHNGIPRGLKLIPKSTGIRCFEGVSS